MSKLKAFLTAIPIPVCGLLLGLISLGNLWANQGQPGVGTFYAMLGFVGLLVMVVKFIWLFEHSFAALNNPVVASVSPTFTMAWMVACVFLHRLFPTAPWVSWIWFAAVCFHFVLMIVFSVYYLFPAKVEFEHIYPSWFITFVGMGVIPNTASFFAATLGDWIIWFTLASYLILLPLVLWRVLVVKKMQEATWPLLTIIAAPGSLCLAGYLATIEQKSLLLVCLLLLLSQILYFGVLLLLPKLLRLPFYPSYAAFTFPLVICATAALSSASYFSELGVTGASLLHVLGRFELGAATLMVTYVAFRYGLFFVQEWSKLRDVPEKMSE